jgi:hypothetical protein
MQNEGDEYMPEPEFEYAQSKLHRMWPFDTHVLCRQFDTHIKMLRRSETREYSHLLSQKKQIKRKIRTSYHL